MSEGLFPDSPYQSQGSGAVAANPYVNDPALQRKISNDPIISIAEPVFPEFITLKKWNVRVRTKAIELMKMKMVQKRFAAPDKPTYEVRLPSGRIETLEMDEEAAKDNVNDQRRWNYYQTQFKKSLEVQNEKIVTTIFFLGTELMDPMPTGWEEAQELLGIEVPTHPDMKRAHFLTTETDGTEIQELLRCIMGKSGVTETEIKSAEDSFRREVPTGTE
jgi:hypothetical protein